MSLMNEKNTRNVFVNFFILIKNVLFLFFILILPFIVFNYFNMQLI